MGQRATDSGTVTLKDVKVEDQWNALDPDAVLPQHVALRFQAGFSAILTGIGIAALRAVCAFVPERARPWGRQAWTVRIRIHMCVACWAKSGRTCSPPIAA